MPSEEALDLAALVAARLLYDMHATQYNVQMQVSENLARIGGSLLSPARKPTWRDADDDEKQKWLDKGKLAVELVLQLEERERGTLITVSQVFEEGFADIPNANTMERRLETMRWRVDKAGLDELRVVDKKSIRLRFEITPQGPKLTMTGRAR